jgi:hypothetical protein
MQAFIAHAQCYRWRVTIREAPTWQVCRAILFRAPRSVLSFMERRSMTEKDNSGPPAREWKFGDRRSPRKHSRKHPLSRRSENRAKCPWSRAQHLTLHNAEFNEADPR